VESGRSGHPNIFFQSAIFLHPHRTLVTPNSLPMHGVFAARAPLLNRIPTAIAASAAAVAAVSTPRPIAAASGLHQHHRAPVGPHHRGNSSRLWTKPHRRGAHAMSYNTTVAAAASSNVAYDAADVVAGLTRNNLKVILGSNSSTRKAILVGPGRCCPPRHGHAF